MFSILLQEAPNSASLFGSCYEGPVIVGVECESGLELQYMAEIVSFDSIFTMSTEEGDLDVADVVAPDIPEGDNLEMYFVSDEELGDGRADSDFDQELLAW